MPLFNIELSMTLESPVFDPCRFLCSPQAVACVASWNTPLGPLPLSYSRPSWTHVDLCHAWNLLYQFEFSIQSHMQAFHFETSSLHKLMSHSLLPCLLLLLTTIYHKWQVLSYLRLCISESASRPLVCFGGLIDTTIKGLTILLSIWAGIDYHNCNLCDEMNQDSRHMLIWQDEWHVLVWEY